MSKKEVAPDYATIAMSAELVKRGKTEYSGKVVDLFQKLAGDRFFEAGNVAIDIMDSQDKTLERALADALDTLKTRVH